MKIALIIYIASWIILLAIYVGCVIDDKSTYYSDDVQSIRKRNIGYYFLLFIFAPLVVLRLLHIVIRVFIQHRKETKAIKDRILHVKEQQKIAFEKYKNAVDSASFLITEEFIEIAENFRLLANERSCSESFDCLNKLSLPADCLLLRLMRCICIYMNDDFVYNIWKYITVEDSYMGIWQAYILNSTFRYRHNAYDCRFYIYSEKSIERIKFITKEQPKAIADVKNFNLTPEIAKDGSIYYVSCCYWNDWSGLNREFVEITIENNKVAEITELTSFNLIKYHCDVLF